MTDSGDATETARRIESARLLDDRPYAEAGAIAPNLARLFEGQASRRPDRSYLVYRNGGERVSFTYAEFYQRCCRIANFMSIDLGVEPGDRVSTVAYNHYDTVAISFAVWLVGAVLMPINIADTDDTVSYVHRNARVRAVFVMPDQIERYNRVCRQVDAVEHYVQINGDAVSGYIDLQAAVQRHQGEFEDLDLANRDSEALIVYTSGTTGSPKGVVLQQQNILANVQATSEWFGFSSDSRMMIVLPIHHVNGLIVTLLTPLVAGGSVVLNRQFSTGDYWRIASQERATCGSVVPTILAFLSERVEGRREHDLDAFAYMICGAGPLSIACARRFEKRFGIPIVHGYGLSETTAFNSTMPLDLSQRDHDHWISAHGFPSVGVPMECNEMAIHDEGGRDLPEDVKGEIVIRGHNVMKGYLERPEDNERAFRHVWFRSGDEGFFKSDARGRKFFFISGRLKELIIRGGVNYSPLEIDEVLSRVDGAKAAMCVGFEHAYYGEEVGAYVVRDEAGALTEADVLAACREGLPFAMQPKVVIFGEDFPVTATGKYQRNRLRPLFAAYSNVQFREDA